MQTRDDEFLKLVGQRAACNPPTLVNTRDLCERAISEDVRGDFVECGVFAGAQCAIMARVASRDKKHVRLVHLFDSFEGIPHAGPEDDETITACVGKNQDGALVSSDVSVASVEQVRSNMSEWGIDSSLLRYHVGWFQETVPMLASTLAARGIAVLRLDGDLYESTLVCLKHLYPLVSAGGFVIIDDYALTGCRKACGCYFGHGFEPIAIEGGGGPVWFRKTGMHS